MRGIDPANMIISMMNWFEENIAVLKQRFPELAERVLQSGINDQVFASPAQDGMPAYGLREGDSVRPITNHINPIELLNQELGQWHEKTNDFSRPILVVGFHPGAEVLHLFQQREQAPGNECAQPLWIGIDSLPIFSGFLQTYDARALLASDRVRLFWYEDVSEQVQWLDEHPEFPYIFSMISLSEPESQMKIFSPFLQVAKQRDQAMADYQEVNNAYYDAIDDETLAQMLSGKAGRPPRLLVPSCPWSTVIQYSIRDTCRAFEKAGWETKILNSPAIIPSHYVMESINQFKPDLFLYVDHLRTEAPGVLPDNLMVVTWVQDPMPAINSAESARRWNAQAAPCKRDLLTGYVEQIRPYGYQAERLVPMSMVVNTDLFRPRELTAEQIRKYGCDICFASNAGLPTDRIVSETLVGVFKEYGFDESHLMDFHDQIWAHYRSGETITSYRQLIDFLSLDLTEQDLAVQLLFWRLNDLIYRHMVIEWLDDYACLHPDFRMNLYGQGWEQHPRFSRYSKGAVEHGEELSVAYQAADMCLHLNSFEGAHQRLWEILACDGNPIVRGRPGCPLAKQLAESPCEHIFNISQEVWEQFGASAAEQTMVRTVRNLYTRDVCGNPLLAVEMENHFLFLSRDSLCNRLSGNHTMSSVTTHERAVLRNTQQSAVTQGIIGAAGMLLDEGFRSSIDPGGWTPGWPELAFAMLRGQEPDEVLDRFRDLADSGATLRLKVASHLAAAGDTRASMELIEGIDRPELAPSRQIECAVILAEVGSLELALSIVAEIHSLFPELHDGYARIGQQLLKAGRYEEALSTFRFDDQITDRLTGEYASVYARAALLGEGRNCFYGIARRFGLSGWKVCMDWLNDFFAGRDEEPDYPVLIELLEDEDVPGRDEWQHAETLIRLLCSAGHFEKATTVHLDASRCHPAEAHSLALSFALHLCHEGQFALSENILSELPLKESMRPIDCFEGAVWCAVSGLYEQSSRCLDLLYQMDPHFFLRYVQGSGLIIWLGVLAHLANDTKLSKDCLKLASIEALTYGYWHDLIKECTSRPSGDSGLEFPAFKLPRNLEYTSNSPCFDASLQRNHECLRK